MAWLRVFVPAIAVVVLFTLLLAGCKTTKALKEYEDQPEDIQEGPTDAGPQPPPT